MMSSECLVLRQDASCLLPLGLSGEQGRSTGAKQVLQLLLSMLKAALVSLAILRFSSEQALIRQAGIASALCWSLRNLSPASCWAIPVQADDGWQHLTS